MCGILGISPPDDRGRFEHSLSLLQHRGPDDGQVFADDAIMLGHRRLAILDLSPCGRQPMTGGGGRYQIVYNGEIYNFVELREQLEQLGHVFRSESDTEVFLTAYLEWGTDCFLRFNGMWAVAIWDSRDRTLMLSRDRFGKKPLYYAHIGNRFVFASEMKAILPFQPHPGPDIDVVRQATTAPFGYEAGDRCVAAGIKRFPAGHFGMLKADRTLSLTRYWDTLDHLMAVPGRYEEQVEMFRELFLDACKIRMRSDVPIGTALSGGLDSSSTVSAMAHISQGHAGGRVNEDWQHAFVATFKGTFLDETVHAKKVVDHIGIKGTFLDIDPSRALGDLNRYFYLFEEPYITSPIPFILTYGAVRDAGIKVTLDGHGADELFAGYSFVVIEALKDAGWHPGRALAVLDTYNDLFPEANQVDKSRLGIGYWARNRLKRLLGTPQRLLRETAGDRRLLELDHLNRALHQMTHETVLPTLLRNYDRYSMANGVEIRMPFMDHRIVSFAFSIPWHSKVRGGFGKMVVRDAMAPYLPHDIAYRKDKIGFNSPTVDWIKGPLRHFVTDTLADQRFKDSEVIQPEVVTRMVRKVLDDPAASFADGERAWTHLAPFFWERAMFGGEG